MTVYVFSDGTRFPLLDQTSDRIKDLRARFGREVERRKSVGEPLSGRLLVESGGEEVKDIA